MQQECIEMRHECTLRYSNGTCAQNVTLCEAWENSCVGEEIDVCVQFVEQAIPNQCLHYSLTCDKETRYDQECVANSHEDLSRINYYDYLLQVMGEFEDIIGPLYEAAFTIQNTTRHSDERRNLVNLTDADSTLELRQIISSNDIEFIFGTRLQSSWTTRYFNLFNSNELTNELLSEQELEHDRTSRVVRVNSHVDFMSLNHTANHLSERIERIVCQLYNVFTEQAEELQIALRDFGLVSGNSTICPVSMSVDDPIVINPQVTEEMPHPTLAAVNSNYVDIDYEDGVEIINVNNMYSQSDSDGEIPIEYYNFSPSSD